MDKLSTGSRGLPSIADDRTGLVAKPTETSEPISVNSGTSSSIGIALSGDQENAAVFDRPPVEPADIGERGVLPRGMSSLPRHGVLIKSNSTEAMQGLGPSLLPRALQIELPADPLESSQASSGKGSSLSPSSAATRTASMPKTPRHAINAGDSRATSSRQERVMRLFGVNRTLSEQQQHLVKEMVSRARAASPKADGKAADNEDYSKLLDAVAIGTDMHGEFMKFATSEHNEENLVFLEKMAAFFETPTPALALELAKMGAPSERSDQVTVNLKSSIGKKFLEALSNSPRGSDPTQVVKPLLAARPEILKLLLDDTFRRFCLHRDK